MARSQMQLETEINHLDFYVQHNYTQFLNDNIFGCKRKIRIPVIKRFRDATIQAYACLIVIVFLIYYFVFNKENHTYRSEYDIGREIYYTDINLSNVVMHLALKGFPLKLSYLKSLLPKLRKLGVTGILMDYENMFPYENELVNLSGIYAYNKSELQEFLTVVVKFGFDIIPMVQTFGHMEHVLKIKEFEHLREISPYSNVICPSKPESRILITNMLEQVIKFHQNIAPIRYFHIGPNKETNQCKKCVLHNRTNADTFFNHIRVTTDFVKKLSPGTTVLMWDDTLRNISMDEWDYYNNLSVEPIYRDYSPVVDVSHLALYKYRQKFKNIWIASAFKGANDDCAILLNVKQRFSNNLSWMELIRGYRFKRENDVYSFKGIILTGWSEYLHASSLYELLPLAIPSLFLNLLLISHFKGGTNFVECGDPRDCYNINFNVELSKWLLCNNLLDIENFNIDECNFDGNELYETVYYFNMVTDISALKNNILKHNIDNINLFNETLHSLWSLEDTLINIFSQYYDKKFVASYVTYKFNTSKKVLHRLLRNRLSPGIISIQ